MKLFHGMNWERYIENRKYSIRSKDEHVFRIIKCQFGYEKFVYRGLKEKRKSFVCPVCLCHLYSPAIAGRELSTT